GLATGKVEDMTQGLTSTFGDDFPGSFPQSIAIDIDQRQARPGTGKEHGGGLAESAGGAGNQHSLIIKIFHMVSLRSKKCGANHAVAGICPPSVVGERCSRAR